MLLPFLSLVVRIARPRWRGKPNSGLDQVRIGNANGLLAPPPRPHPPAPLLSGFSRRTELCTASYRADRAPERCVACAQLHRPLVRHCLRLSEPGSQRFSRGSDTASAGDRSFFHATARLECRCASDSVPVGRPTCVSDTAGPQSGRSEMERMKSAQAAARTMLQELRKSSRATSQESTGRLVRLPRTSSTSMRSWPRT